MLAVVDHVSHAVLRSFGAKSLETKTPVGRVHAYDLRGRGEGTYVLVHGMGTAATSYVGVVRRLRSQAKRIVLLDLPGHGRSQAPEEKLDAATLKVAVSAALDAALAGSDKAVMLGTSLGGAVALGYALERPERVRSLVLASPAGAPLEDADMEALRARFDLRTREDARRFFKELLHAPPFYLRVMESGLVTQLSRPLIRDFLRSLEAEDFFTAERVGELQPPATVLWGKSDRILPRSGLAFYRRALPQGTAFEELDAVGHSPHLECPQLVADRLVSAHKWAGMKLRS